MTIQQQSKREILKGKVVSLVKDFVKTEGGITQWDLQILFGVPDTPDSQVATALSELPVLFS